MMNTPEWLSRSVSKLLPNSSVGSVLPAARPKPQGKSVGAAPVRSTSQRLAATLGKKGEGLSPRALRRLHGELKAVIDPRLSELEGGRRAGQVATWYGAASAAERLDCWLLMAEQFAPDARKVQAAREQFDALHGTAEQGRAEMRLRQAFLSPRTRLLQRFAAFAEGVRFLVDLRAELLGSVKTDERLVALDGELEALFSTWFDVGFLELRRISWDSPASLVEKLIKYEAVHDIKSWGDVKNRLDSDRRCYGFFHPRLEGEPLIFVEVAFMDAMASSITPLLDEAAAAVDLKKSSTAIFYSISSTQKGLKGVSFGDSLIKRVVETLQQDFPKLKTFATLSPIPGFRPWLGKNADALISKLGSKAQAELRSELALTPNAPLEAAPILAALEEASALAETSALRRWLTSACAQYLGRELKDGQPLDPVARFHLGNGARVDRLNWAADPSSKGYKQSYGLMVNYLYDPKRLDKNRTLLANGAIAVSRDIESHFP